MRTAETKVSVRDLWMSFPGKKSGGDVHVLERVNLQVHEGEFVCIVGPSGCGKSTLLNIVGSSADLAWPMFPNGRILVSTHISSWIQVL